MNSSRARRAAALADRMPEAPADVLARMQAYLPRAGFPDAWHARSTAGFLRPAACGRADRQTS